MRDDPHATVARWEQAITDRQSPDELAQFVAHEFPEAARDAAGRGLVLKVNRVAPLSTATQVLRRTAVFRTEFGWNRGHEYAAWKTVMALGPGGLRRLSGRPEVLREALALDMPTLRPDDAEAMAHLLVAAVLGDRPPSTSAMNESEWRARRQSSLLTAERLEQIDGDDSGPMPLDRQVWTPLRQSIAPPSLEPLPGGAAVTLAYLEFSGPAEPRNALWLFRVLRLRGRLRLVGQPHDSLASGFYRDPFPADGGALEVQRDDLGEVACMVSSGYSLGRPLVVEGVPRQATLVRQRAWPT